MTINRRFLYWGVFLVTAGAVVLIGTSDGIDRGAVTDALRLWPVVVIALGVGVILRRTRLAMAGGVLAAVAPGLLLGGLVVAAPNFAGCGDIRPATYATRQGTFSGPASVDLRISCGDLTVTTAQGTGWQLQAGSANAGGSVDLDSTSFVSTRPDRLQVRSSGTGRRFGFHWGGDAWRLALPTAIALDLTAELNAGEGRFDLTGAQLGNVRLAVNAGDSRVDLSGATVANLSMSVNAAAGSVILPTTGDFAADLSANAGSLKICAGDDLGLRIHEQTTLGSTRLAGLVKDGDAWETPNYSIAPHHADVNLKTNLGSVDINPLGGCQ